jgi:hypothetical protein
MGSFAKPHSAADETQVHLAQAMVLRIRGMTSHAEALRALRAAFPDSPLAVRVAALATLPQRSAAEPSRLHIPR